MTDPVFVIDAEVLRQAEVGATVRLDGAEGRHAVTVRRLAVGERIRLVDGRGAFADTEAIGILDAACVELAVRGVGRAPEPEPRVVVVQALAKAERGELAVELLTESGVDEIVPWAARHCVAVWRGERGERSRRRWVDTAHAAAKQSRRTRFPVVADLASTADVARLLADATLGLVLHEQATAPIGSVGVPASGTVVLVVGPEGGIAPAERAAFGAVGAREVRLGPTVLRTSSAGIAAVSALFARHRRWLADAGGADVRMAP